MELIVSNGGREERVRVRRLGSGYEIAVGEAVYQVDSVATDGCLFSLLVEGVQHEVAVRPLAEGRYAVSGRGRSTEVEVMDPLAHLARETRAAAGLEGRQQVTAYMPGRVVTVLVEEGAEVEAGQGIVVLEAMKMENEIRAEHSGVVRRILVEPGQAVEGGDPLFEIEGS